MQSILLVICYFLWTFRHEEAVKKEIKESLKGDKLVKKWLIVVSILFIIWVPAYDLLNVELHEISKGEFLSEQPSPNNQYKARAYLINEGGAWSVYTYLDRKIKVTYT